MMQEIAGLDWDLEVGILGVNGIGAESGNASACAGKDIPWLQETTDDPAWDKWNVVYRDVIILDGENVAVATYNLSSHDLGNPANYAALMALLEAAANP